MPSYHCTCMYRCTDKCSKRLFVMKYLVCNYGSVIFFLLKILKISLWFISDQSVEDCKDESNIKPVINVSKSALQKDSVKDLNKKNYQLSENIRQLRKEVEKMEGTRERQIGNQAALSVINSKLQSKKMELQRLQEAERKVQGEQQSRKNIKKLCVF